MQDTATRPFREILDAVDRDLGPAGMAAPTYAPRPPRPEARVEDEAPTEPADHTAELLAAREGTHGSFADNARVSQALKRILRAEPGWELLTDVERESMDMIALKFSRIVSGKSLELQHWEDVVGYGKLAEEQCR